MTEGDDSGARPDSRRSDWRFLIDENLDPAIATALDARRIRAEHLLEALFEGADDMEDILPYCRETGAILVTNNVRDFNTADVAPADHAGIVIVHDKDRPPARIASEIERIVAAYPGRDAFDGFESADDWTPP